VHAERDGHHAESAADPPLTLALARRIRSLILRRMRIWWLMLVMVAGCDQGSSCKEAVIKAQTTLDLKRDDAEKMIGRCEMKPWTGKERACIAGAADIKSAIACGDGLTDLRARVDFAEAMNKMSEFKDKMCACKDMACAQRVSDEMSRWSQEMAKEQQEPPRMTEDDTKRATAIGEEMGKCMQKAMSAVEPQVDRAPTRQ
jgi:hypothetical protein